MNKITRTLAHVAATLSLFGASHALAQELVIDDPGSLVSPDGTDGTSIIVDPPVVVRPDEESRANPAALGSVISVNVSFRDGRWSQASEPEVIHCRAPRNGSDEGTGAEIRLVDETGRVLNQRNIFDPRMVLAEDPRREWRPLEELDMPLMIAMKGEPTRIEFYEDPRNQDKPSLVVDLTHALVEFMAQGGRRIPNCENADPPFVQLGNQPVFVLAYALERVSQATGLSGEELVELLMQYGDKIGTQIEMPKAVQHLLFSSIYEIQN